MPAEGERETASGASAAPLQSSPIVELAKQMLVYGLSGVALQAIGLLTLPVLARVFTQAEYGKLELATVLMTVFLAFVDAGFASSAQRSFYDYTRNQPDERRTVIATALRCTTLVGVVAAVTLALAREPTARWLFGHAADAPLVVAIAVAIPLVNTANFLREAMRLEFRAWQYVASSVLASFVAAGLGILAVVAFDQHVRGVFLGVIGGNMLAVVYGAFVMRRDIGGQFSTHELRTMLRYGLPLVPVAVAMWSLTLVDRIMLNKLGSLAQVGEYAVANRVANVLLLGVTGFALAFGPYIFSIYSEDRELERIVRAQALRYLTIGLAGAGLVLTLFARELIDLLAPGFDTAYEVVGLLCLAVAVFGVSTVAMAGISYARRTELFTFIALTAAALNIGLNFALIPPFGIVGAAVANLAAYLLLASSYYVFAQRLYPTPFEPWKVVMILGLATGLGVLGVVPIQPLALALAVKTAAVGVFVVLLRVTRIVMPEEIDRLRELVGNARRVAALRA